VVFWWQSVQARPECFPLVIGNLWLNVAPDQVVVLVWQFWQVVGKFADLWLGFVVALYSAKWHETHAVGVPA